MELLLDEDTLKYYNQDIFAKTAASVLYDTVYSSDDKDVFKKLFDTKKILFDKHPYNIVLRNAANFFLHNLPHKGIRDAAKEKYTELIKKINSMNKELAVLGAKKIRAGSSVMVHSANNHLYDIIAEASKYKKFTVNLVEHAPFSFGKQLKEKMKNNAAFKVFPDLAIKEAALESDACFIGGEAIKRDASAITKVGSMVAAETCHHNHIPVYVCTHSLKYDHDNLMADSLSHQHKTHDAGRLYEILSKEFITAYINEHGVFRPEHLIDEIKFYNGWLFI